MLITLLIALSASAADYQFHIIEDAELWASVECLPKKQQERLKDPKREVFVIQSHQAQGDNIYGQGERKWMDLGDTREILKECNMNGMKVFFDGKLYPLGTGLTAKYIEKETGGECGYSVPRLELKFWNNNILNGFTLAQEFSVITGKEKQKVEEDFMGVAKKLHEAGGEYRGKPQAAFRHRLEKDAVFVVTDQTEMGKVMALFRRKNKKWEKVDSASFEPCGS